MRKIKMLIFGKTYFINNSIPVNNKIKDIVIWNKVITWLPHMPIAFQKYIYSMYEIDTKTLSILIGTLLSDAWMYLDLNNRSTNPRFGFKQSIININYFTLI